ncbi:ensconsin-like isoform X1 [Platichthys flesus]|uniref:ensconsin-like isoform X1 n=1 Tax=Platichthys flesus TaxID=8260 RepID=UPI002DBEB497|nr:ensconsin-like isoform X1 [Platichthys flesus]
MPGSIPSMAVQKKQSGIPPSQGPLSTRTIERQGKGNGLERTGENGSYIRQNLPPKKTAPSVNKSPQILNAFSPRVAAVANGPNVDERLKAARERREEQEKLVASRELSRLEREQRARQFHQQQVEERKKKILEQRHREDRRRSAVEEKRKQRLQEEKERYESAVRKTLEKSQRAQYNISPNTRGRKVTNNVPRRLPLTPWEKNLVSRLGTPTCSYLARSKSAGCQSGEEVVHVCRRAVSFHSMNTTTTSSTPHKPQQHSGSVQQRPSASPSPNNRSLHLAQIKTPKQQDTIKTPESKKNSSRSSNIRSVITSVKPATVTQSRKASPSPVRSPRRSVSRQSTPLQLELTTVPEEAVCHTALAPGNSRPVRTSSGGRTEKMKSETPEPVTPCLNLPNKAPTTAPVRDKSPSHRPPDPSTQPSEVVSRPLAGTTDQEAASRLLAEKRREARLQRERDEQERLQREEAERRSREEAEHRRAEEREQQQAEAQRLMEEKRRREEEEQRRAEEERAQAKREAALLQKQREEEEARDRAKAEKLKQERQMLAQKEEVDRQERKKRLEEIMRRTRRTDSPDTTSSPVRLLPNAPRPKENTEPVHNGTIEHVVKLPVGTRSTQLGLNNEEEGVPVVAFKERRSLRTLTGLEEIQTHQRAEVI